ncbi:MAG: hypothetical protein IPP26_11300 [Flavobacteriales bacterium]|nr:hypothetical protein [Flavobacteriales bacterium]
MLPAPDTIHQCPHCNAKARKSNLLSGNTFGSQLWSDGYMHAPMLPEMVQVTRCPGCRRIYWLADAQELRVVPGPVFEEQEVVVKRKWWFGTRKEKRSSYRPSPLADLPKLEHLDADGLVDALAEITIGSSPGSEEYLRTKIWWAYNDSFRNEPSASTAPLQEDDHRMNLEALLPLIDADDDQGRLKSAAVLLALGRFGYARAVAEEVVDKRLVPFKAKFIEAAEGHHGRVFRLR